MVHRVGEPRFFLVLVHIESTWHHDTCLVEGMGSEDMERAVCSCKHSFWWRMT